MKENKKTKIFNQAVFILPTALLFAAFVIFPFFFSFITSFSEWNGISNDFRWIGVNNYLKAITDKSFLQSFIYTIKNTAAITIIANIIGFVFALILSFNIKGGKFFKTTLVLPNILSGIVLGFIWKFIFMKGLPGLGDRLNFDFLNITWLGTRASAFWSIVIVGVWQMSGYVMLIYTAGILSIPKEIFESVYVDRASNWQMIRYIIFPYLKPSFLICTFWTVSKNLILFDLPFALTQGGPFNSTETMAINIYRETFEKNNYGYGSAKAILFFMSVILISVLQVFFKKEKEANK